MNVYCRTATIPALLAPALDRRTVCPATETLSYPTPQEGAYARPATPLNVLPVTLNV
ncbi:MAG: hypothetical protein J0651_02670 [Actinobacteria bacterium]|nr:hypothetical protein [Actinomycetota bacterium]